MANNTTSPTASFPLSAKNFNSYDAKCANQLIDYYEGRQKAHLINMLDGKAEGGYGKRVEWKQRGIVPRVRNVTKSIVDKSGLLFNRAPKLAVQVPTKVDAVTDPLLNAILEGADWLEFFQNVDVYSRLTKSVIVLQQKYIPEDTVTVNGQYRFDASNGDALLLTLLHQGNSCAKMNPQRTKITALAFLTNNENGALSLDSSSKADDSWGYRLITEQEIIDVVVTSNDQFQKGQNEDSFKEIIVNRQVNPDGIVPASFFYDINKPRLGCWTSPPEDLRSLQELYNLALTDMEYAISWNKQRVAVITGNLVNNDDNNQQMVPAAQPGFTPGGAVYNDIAAFQQKTASNLGGLGSIIKMGLDDAGNPGKLTFEGPNSDLKALQEILDVLVEGVASDWDVNLKYGGGGSATSGFQLVVEEMNNLNLREKRASSMVAGFRRFYEIMKQLYPGQLTEGMLQAEFAPPNLPVNQAEMERLWDDKIDNNRASIVDYFMISEGMTEEQAMAKLEKTIKINNLVAAEIVPPPQPIVAEQQQAQAFLKPQRVDQNNG